MKKRCGVCGREDLALDLVQAQPHVDEASREKGATHSG